MYMCFGLSLIVHQPTHLQCSASHSAETGVMRKENLICGAVSLLVVEVVKSSSLQAIHSAALTRHKLKEEGQN